MKRVEIKLHLEVVAPLLDVMKRVAVDLEPRLALEINVPGEDNEFKDGWEAELLEGQTSDIQKMLGMFDREFFVSGTIAFDPTNCEPILRACSALRLRLREKQLQSLRDENLESNEVGLAEMSEPQRKAFGAYVLLATLQELLVHHLDPNVMEE